MNTAAYPSKMPALPFPWPVLLVTLVVIAALSIAGMIGYKSQLDDAHQRLLGLEAEAQALENIAREREQALESELTGYKSELNAAQLRERLLSARNNRLRIDFASARTQNEELKQSVPSLSQWPTVIEEFKKKGLQDPERDIVADLMKHNELIPYEGVLGGKMCLCFPEAIYVLNYKWVLAYFEDGHIAGRMLLEYQIGDNGAISWRVLDAVRE